MYRRIRTWLCLTLILAGTGAAVVQHFVVVNMTPSFPEGIYRKLARPAVRGDLVLVCPPDTPFFHAARARGFVGPGLCPGGMGYLIKRLAAIGGDQVCLAFDGVTINGERLENSQRQSLWLEHMDEIPWPFCGTLNNRETLLMSPHPLSFDSRYFGIVPDTSIITPLEPFSWN